MSETIEVAKTGRARCRICRQPIEKGALRFGEEQPSAFTEGLQMVWHHLACAAKKRPAPLRRALAGFEGEVPGQAEIEGLLVEAEKTAVAFPYAGRASTGRSKCQHCQEPIEKGALRVAVEREVEAAGMLRAGTGYLHAACARDYIGGEDLLGVLRGNSKGLSEADLGELTKAVSG